MPDPEAVGIPEVHGNPLDAAAGGACLFCGEWIELARVPGYVIEIESPTGFAEYVSHRTCLAERVHESVNLPASS